MLNIFYGKILCFLTSTFGEFVPRLSRMHKVDFSACTAVDCISISIEVSQFHAKKYLWYIINSFVRTIRDIGITICLLAITSELQALKSVIFIEIRYDNDTHLTAILQVSLGKPVPECLHSGFYWS